MNVRNFFQFLKHIGPTPDERLKDLKRGIDSGSFFSYTASDFVQSTFKEWNEFNIIKTDVIHHYCNFIYRYHNFIYLLLI